MGKTTSIVASCFWCCRKLLVVCNTTLFGNRSTTAFLWDFPHSLLLTPFKLGCSIICISKVIGSKIRSKSRSESLLFSTGPSWVETEFVYFWNHRMLKVAAIPNQNTRKLFVKPATTDRTLLSQDRICLLLESLQGLLYKPRSGATVNWRFLQGFDRLLALAVW